MNYKFKDYVGIFLISGGKNSVLTLDMYHLQFINRIGILIEVDNITITDNEYIKYLEQKYNMTILKINIYKSSIEKKLLENIDIHDLKILSNPIYIGLSEIRNLLMNLQISKYKLILGANKTHPLNIKQNELLINPLFKLTEEEVLNECKKRDLKLTDTYKNGFTKHDSFPSLLWGSSQNIDNLEQNIKLLKKYYPKRYNFWSNWEKENNTPYFKIREDNHIWINKI